MSRQAKTTRDAWQERYAAIQAKLTAEDANTILDLIEEDTDRFVEALAALAISKEAAPA